MNQFAYARKRANLTQEYVAKELNVDRSTVSKWETGENKPHFDMLIKLSSMYACTIDELAGIGEHKAV